VAESEEEVPAEYLEFLNQENVGLEEEIEAMNLRQEQLEEDFVIEERELQEQIASLLA